MPLALLELGVLKRCSKCKVEKEYKEFHKRGDSNGIRSKCKECYNRETYERQLKNPNIKQITKKSRRKRYLNKKNLLINAKQVPCADCLITYPHYILEFDHKDVKTKLFSVSQFGPYDTNEIKNEIDKCEIVCGNCHRMRTQKQFQYTKNKRRKNLLINQHLEKIKSETPCNDCKRFYPYFIMEFDHVPELGTKKLTISRTASYSKEDIIKELKKCDLVCRNCHKERTNERSRT